MPFVRNRTQRKTLSSDSADVRLLVADRIDQTRLHFREIRQPKEALMAGMRSERARARARDLLATEYSVPDACRVHPLRGVSLDFIQEDARLHGAARGGRH